MLVRLDHVQKTYPDFHLNCSLEVPEGKITALIGTNGAGKSTTFKAILGLIFPEKGEIEVFGKPIQDLKEKDREQIGVALSNSVFSGFLSVRDMLPVLEKLYSQFSKEDFLKKCNQFGLPLDKKIKDFSTGMKAKLKVLIAVSHDAKLLILDEPTAGLDVLAREDVLDILRDYMLPGNRSILISSHISSDLEGLCDDIYLIERGEVIFHEEMDRLLNEYGILKVTEEQYKTLDKRYVLREKAEHFGYSLLTSQKQFYLENTPELVVEKGSIDHMIMMMTKGEVV
ncbi:MAG: ABC transporter ATP-binding protein [Lachnospiraceae bacterium]|nr:ABC transporter ATP-binding protein [Lachnospiraceae bacterium]